MKKNTNKNSKLVNLLGIAFPINKHLIEAKNPKGNDVKFLQSLVEYCAKNDTKMLKKVYKTVDVNLLVKKIESKEDFVLTTSIA